MCCFSIAVHEKMEVLTAKYKALQSGDKSDPGGDVQESAAAIRSAIKKPCMHHFVEFLKAI